MSDVLEELAEEAEGRVDRRHVEDRLNNWRDRLARLYQDICSWLPHGMSADTDSSVPMYEPMMARYGVSSLDLPVLTLRREETWFGKLVPGGLWIIGANGRVDLFTNNSHFILADRAENFAPPRWMIASSQARRDQKILNKSSFLSAIGD